MSRDSDHTERQRHPLCGSKGIPPRGSKERCDVLALQEMRFKNTRCRGAPSAPGLDVGARLAEKKGYSVATWSRLPVLETGEEQVARGDNEGRRDDRRRPRHRTNQGHQPLCALSGSSMTHDRA